MAGILIGILVGAGAAMWAYNQTFKRTGGNTQQSGIMAGVAGFGVFLIVWLLYSMIS
jgi:hypothetical protein